MKSALVSLIIGFISAVFIGPLVIKTAKKLKAGQPILGYVQSHIVKQGTPTMGGVIFLFGALVSFICFINDNIRLASICIAAMFGYALLGFLDDFLKVKFTNNLGLRAYQKVIGQLGISTLIAVFIYYSSFVGTTVVIPFTYIEFNLGWFIIPFVIFIFIAATNSVNLTDGLDGLAGGVSFIYLIGFIFVLYLYISNLKHYGESVMVINELTNVLILCGGVAGSILGFLCFNIHPAKIFMGDTGSLAIGGFIACAAALTKLYLYLPFLGVMFVLSAISVIMQVGYYKLTKKRIFKMAPLHHHFEKKGSYETKIVGIYIVITILMCVATISFLV